MTRPLSGTIATCTGFAALAATLCLVSTAEAASFDCKKASTKMEKAICGDPALSRLDETLGSAYKTARSALSPDAAKSLTSSQQSWLKFVSSVCFTDDTGGNAEPTDATACLNDRFQARVEQLQATGHAVDGLKTYWVVDAAFRTFPEESSRSGVENSYMQIDDTSPLAATLNGLLRKGFEEKAAIGDDEAGSMITNSVSLTSVNPDLLCITAHGEAEMGVHPTAAVSHQYFSKSLGKVITVGDIFSSDSWRDTAKQLAVADLQKRNLEAVSEPGEVLAQITLGEKFGFDFAGKTGFTISGMFLSYADRGEDSVELPWSAFAAILTPYAKQLIDSLPSA